MANDNPLRNKPFSHNPKNLGGQAKRQLAPHRLHFHPLSQRGLGVKDGQHLFDGSNQPLPLCRNGIGFGMLGIGKRQNRRIVCKQGSNFLFAGVHPVVNLVQPDGKLRADFQIGVAGLA